MSRSSVPVFLLLVCIAFTGCGNGDDPLPIFSGGTSSTITSISPKVVLTKKTVGASIRAALNTAGAQLTLELANETTVVMNAAAETSSTVTFQTASPVSLSNFQRSGSSYNLDVTALINGVTIPIRVLVPGSLGGSTLTATNADVSAAVDLATDANGKVTYTYSVTYIPAGTTSQTNTGTNAPPSGVTPVSLPSLYIEKITWLNGSVETVLGSYETTNVSYSSPSFRIYFNQQITSLPTSYSMDAKSSVGTQTYSNQTTANATLDSGSKSITFYPYSGGGTTMSPGTAYDISFNSSTITAATGTGSVTLYTGSAYKIKTSGSASQSLAIEKITATVSASEYTLGQVEPNNVSFTQPVFKFYFTGAISGIPASYSVTATDTARFGNSDLSASMTLSTDRKVLTMTVNGQATSSKLLPNTTYTISFASGLIYAEGTTAGPISLNTGSTYRLSTKKTSLINWNAETYNALTGLWTATRSGSTVASTTGRIVLYFDYPVPVPSDLLTNPNYQFGRVNARGSATLAYKDFFTEVISSGTMFFQKFIAGRGLGSGSYTIYYANGSFLDSAGKPLDTSSSISFSVQ